ncbi:MAG TPA: universal stress protein [Sphingobacteriaceae bacterium]|nr:universal stress protein [Sphingobacteriaceae bacterium]
MTKTILVPTDFSENARKALNYAVGLALQQGYTLQLVHVYQALTSRFGDEKFNREIIDHAETEAMHKLEELRVTIQEEHPNLKISTDCIAGDQPSAVLTQIAGKAHNELIIMGTKGAGGLKHRLMGSNTYQTITNSPIPVLAVPEAYDNFKLERVGLLSNFKKIELEIARAFTAIFGKNLQFTVLHVQERASPSKEDNIQLEKELEAWKNHLIDKTGILDITWAVDSTMNRLDVTETLPDCIHHMAEDHDLHMLLVSYNTKSFFQRVFSRSLVKNIAHQIQRPVFFFKEGIDNQK